MALTGNGSSDFVATAASITAPQRYSAHFFYQNGSAPGTAVVHKPFSVADSGANYDLSFCWDHTSVAKTWFHRRSSGSYDSVTHSALSASTWYGLGASYDGTNVDIYKNGAADGSTASADPFSDAPTPCALAGNGGTANFDDGTIAEVALWNTALSASEFGSLGKGVSPLLIRPGSLVIYWPLIRDVVPTFGNITSGGGLTVDTHPPIFEACAQSSRRFTSDASYLVTVTGGLTISGTSTVAPDFVATPDGGLVLGGVSDVMIDVSVTCGLNFGIGVDKTHVRDRIAFGNTNALLDQFGSVAAQVFFTSTFQGNSGDLANGRQKDRIR